MKLEYDKEADAAYFYIAYPINEGEIKKSLEIKENIIFDFDKEGRIIGIEILNASKMLNQKVLCQSDSI